MQSSVFNLFQYLIMHKLRNGIYINLIFMETWRDYCPIAAEENKNKNAREKQRKEGKSLTFPRWKQRLVAENSIWFWKIFKKVIFFFVI